MFLTDGEACGDPRLRRGRLEIGREDEVSGVANRRTSELVVEVDRLSCGRAEDSVVLRCRTFSSSLARARTDARRAVISCITV
jgi:hypothetical protein